jgi:hypothetical protein
MRVLDRGGQLQSFLLRCEHEFGGDFLTIASVI